MNISIRSFGYHQNTKTLCQGLLEVKQASPSFDNFSNHQAGRGGSQLIVGTCNRIQTKSYQEVPKGFSKVSAGKKTFWFMCKQPSGSAPPGSERFCHLLFTLNWDFWEFRVQNSSYPSCNNHYLSPIFGPSK